MLRKISFWMPIVMLCLLPLGLHAAAETESPQYAEIPVTQFTVSGILPQETDPTLDWWYSETEDCRLLFLPAAADRTSLTITYTAAGTLSLNGTAVESGAETDLLSADDLFAVTVDGIDCGTLRVMQSTLGSVWISLEEGELDRIDCSRFARTSGMALMLAADGAEEYRGALESLGGRGNSSWDYTQKKPYNFKLPQKASLYGMGKARKWALLGNQLDESMLRNEAAFAMSRQSGLAFTPDAVFVDLYIDGGYRGTYQLAERVTVHSKRVDITDLKESTEACNPLPLGEYPRVAVGKAEAPNSYVCYDIPNDPADITGGYLFQFQLGGRADKGVFTTSRGQICDIKAPEYPSQAQIAYIRNFVQEMEDAVYSETGYNAQGRHYSEYLDVDSVLLGWLVQEITENIDGAATSFYFYKDSDKTGDGRLHYGPVWDFDLAYMNFRNVMTDEAGGKHYSMNPETLFALYRHSSGEREGLLMKLWARDDLALRASVLYEERFDGFLTELTAGGTLAEMSAALTHSAEMNRVRWASYVKLLGPVTGKTYAETVAYLEDFLTRRQAYLRGLFAETAHTRSAAMLEALFARRQPEAYDEAERAQRTELYEATAAALQSAQTAAEAADVYERAEAAFAEIQMRELSGDFDADGAVTLMDSQRLLMYYAETVLGGAPQTADATARRNGDVNRDGVLDIVDSMHILIHYASELTGENYPLPVV